MKRHLFILYTVSFSQGIW